MQDTCKSNQEFATETISNLEQQLRNVTEIKEKLFEEQSVAQEKIHEFKKSFQSLTVSEHPVKWQTELPVGISLYPEHIEEESVCLTQETEHIYIRLINIC